MVQIGDIVEIINPNLLNQPERMVKYYQKGSNCKVLGFFLDFIEIQCFPLGKIVPASITLSLVEFQAVRIVERTAEEIVHQEDPTPLMPIQLSLFEELVN